MFFCEFSSLRRTQPTLVMLAWIGCHGPDTRTLATVEDSMERIIIRVGPTSRFLFRKPDIEVRVNKSWSVTRAVKRPFFKKRRELRPTFWAAFGEGKSVELIQCQDVDRLKKLDDLRREWIHGSSDRR